MRLKGVVSFSRGGFWRAWLLRVPVWAMALVLAAVWIASPVSAEKGSGQGYGPKRQVS